MLSRYAFRSLRHRNFRIFYTGQLISLNGTWMQTLAQSWLIYRLTESGFMLGLVGTLTLLPSLVFGVFGGWLADRFERRLLLIIVMSIALLQALVLGILTVGGWVEPWHILVLALVMGLIQAVETPARQAFIAQLIERQDLPNAIALNASMFHLARFIGPAIAGVAVAAVGEGPVFLLNAASFIAVLISLKVLRLPATPVNEETRSGLSGLWSGFHYAWQHRPTRVLLTMVATVSLLGSSTMILMPIFVAKVFAHGAESLGAFMGMLGAGSLTAALILANRRDFELLERRIALAAVLMGMSLLVFALTHIYGLALLVLLVIGFCTTMVYASSNTLIQLAVPDHLRGRIMAVYALCLHGVVAIGQLILGSFADLVGAPITAGVSGVALAIAALLLTRSIYRLDPSATSMNKTNP